VCLASLSPEDVLSPGMQPLQKLRLALFRHFPPCKATGARTHPNSN
jgi:hypothetical protein